MSEEEEDEEWQPDNGSPSSLRSRSERSQSPRRAEPRSPRRSYEVDMNSLEHALPNPETESPLYSLVSMDITNLGVAVSIRRGKDNVRKINIASPLFTVPGEPQTFQKAKLGRMIMKDIKNATAHYTIVRRMDPIFAEAIDVCRKINSFTGVLLHMARFLHPIRFTHTCSILLRALVRDFEMWQGCPGEDLPDQRNTPSLQRYCWGLSARIVIARQKSRSPREGTNLELASARLHDHILLDSCRFP
jgi:hypothetical protein